MHQKVVRRGQDTYDRVCTEAVECRLKWGEVGTERGAKLSPKVTKMLPILSTKGTEMEPKGCQKRPRYLLGGILSKTANSGVEMVAIRAPSWH